MRRREFISLLGGAAASTLLGPLVARAQQSKPVVGFLRTTSAAGSGHLVAAFRMGLGEAGFVEGKNVAIEYHWAGDRRDQLPGMVADLIRRRVAVIVGNSTSAHGPSVCGARGSHLTVASESLHAPVRSEDSVFAS